MFTLSEYNKNIGTRVKELRELSDVSVEEIIDDLKIDKETYEKYEKGEVDIPASFLCEISNVLCDS